MINAPAKTFANILDELRKLLVEDIAATLSRLQTWLPADSYKQDEILLLLGKYNNNRTIEIQGICTYDEIRRLDNQVRRDCLVLINELSEKDFDPSKRAQKSSSGRQGYLLYRIPRQMTIGEETRCIVRISFNLEVARENITIDGDTEEKDLKKISKSMLIEMSDPSRERNFDIRSTSKGVQTIDFDGEEYTEWRFYVTPLRVGRFVIEIKVCVIELVDGEKELREKVLEEKVLITANREVSLEQMDAYQQAGLVYGFISDNRQGVISRLVNSLRSWRGIIGLILLLPGSFWLYKLSVKPAMLYEDAANVDTRSLYLPDSSEVWLRRGTVIKYPEYFENNERRVILNGEAYFDVKSHPDMPFLIETEDEDQVEVIGTEFGVLTTDSIVMVIVRNGKVLFTPAQTSSAIVLTKNQKAVFDRNTKSVTKDELRSLNDLAWQSGELTFIRTPLYQVIENIKQFYGIHIILKNPAMADCIFIGQIDTSIPAKRVVESLASTFSFKVLNPTPDTFELNGGSCQ